MIKFTAVLVVLYALNCFFFKLYFNGCSVSDKLRLSFMKQYNKAESIWLTIIGIMRLLTPICIDISVLMLVFKYI